MSKKLLYGGFLVAASLLLAACGGGGGGDEEEDDDDTTPTSSFTGTSSWQVALPASGQSVCYDFDTKAEVAGCSGNAWDLKLTSGGLTGTLYTNSGVSGSGSGAALGGPFDSTWAELQALTKADASASGWKQDSLKTVFTGTNTIASAAFEYGHFDLGLTNVHQVFPNYRTFLITTDNTQTYANGILGTNGAKVFALQFTAYTSPAFRYADRTLAVNTDADNTNDVVQTSPAWSASTDWVYYNLTSNTVVGSPSVDNWHIAILKSGQSFSVKLNGGISGTGGKVGAFLAKTPDGLYTSGTPNAAAFQDVNLSSTAQAHLTVNDSLAAASGGLAKPSNASAWVKDSANSSLNPAYTGTYPSPLNYGWFTYYSQLADAQAAGLGAAHQIKAKSENGVLLRSGEGNSYGRFHLTNINYANPALSNSQQTWTFEFDIQPAP